MVLWFIWSKFLFSGVSALFNKPKSYFINQRSSRPFQLHTSCSDSAKPVQLGQILKFMFFCHQTTRKRDRPDTEKRENVEESTKMGFSLWILSGLNPGLLCQDGDQDLVRI